jgi:ADP-heptose:LPS heptosyltransferase
LLNVPRAALPTEIPYLSADSDLAARWREELSRIPEFKIGIVWQGSPEHKKDCLRSVSLREFAPLARLTGVRLFSLQVGSGSEQLARRSEFAVTDLASAFDPTSFADAAAAIVNLDLVVTVDTATAHLAGALGKPVWVALPSRPDWRWLLKRADSPWYPSMRLFRQTDAGQWSAVFERMAGELAGQKGVRHLCVT